MMMRKKEKIQIIQPFINLKDNWQLINEIESSLNKYLNNPNIYTNLQPEDQNQKLTKLNLENIIKYVKNIMQVLQNIKTEQKNIENIKANAKIAQEKMEQHEDVIKNYEKKFNERTKTLVDQNRMYKQTIDKLKKNHLQLEQNMKIRMHQKEEQIETYKKRQEQLQNQNKRLLLVINELQDEIKNMKDKLFKLTKINQQDQSIKKVKQKIIELAEYRRKYKKNQFQKIDPGMKESFFERLPLKDIQAFSKLISFLTPKEIGIMTTLNKQLRLIIMKSKYCNQSLNRSIIAVKNKKISYYHQHIKYFQNMYNKIPDQILQLTYFKYHILKENVGTQIMQILNKSATIFQGKFMEGEELYSGINQQPEQMLNFKINLAGAHILDVDPAIVDEYNEERSQQRQKLMKLLQNMYNKICNTYQLYRADLQSSELFISNILKHFSKVFILSKNLYIQSQNLQKLNHFLLNELNKWDRMEIDKKLRIEDLKAQLQAEKRLKLYFTDKSIKSEQKALIQENLKLTFEMKYNKLTDSMNVTCAEKEELFKKYEQHQKTLESLSQQNKQNRKKYEFYLQKYNKVIEQLTVVKQTIVKMNI